MWEVKTIIPEIMHYDEDKSTPLAIAGYVTKSAEERLVDFLNGNHIKDFRIMSKHNISDKRFLGDSDVIGIIYYNDRKSRPRDI